LRILLGRGRASAYRCTNEAIEETECLTDEISKGGVVQTGDEKDYSFPYRKALQKFGGIALILGRGSARLDFGQPNLSTIAMRGAISVIYGGLIQGDSQATHYENRTGV